MPHIRQLIPDAATLLALPVEELAGCMMQHMASERDPRRGFTPGQFIYDLFGSDRPEFPHSARSGAEQAFRDAWAWIESQGFLVWSDPYNDNGHRVLGKKGRAVATSASMESYQRAAMLPAGLLHPDLVGVHQNFMQGAYDPAVFAAFHAVEVAVRNAAGLAETDYGVDLMRKAFNSGGPLRDPREVGTESDALAHIFAGAIGRYKNPRSHRKTGLTDPREAAEMVMLASHLLYVVDTRRGP